MIKYLLKLNYVLSCWFSKDKKTIIPGTIHLFLTNIMYLAIMVLFILNAFIPIIIETKILVAIFIVVSLLIMTAFRGSVERMISNEKLKSIIENYSKKEIYEKRFIGLFFTQMYSAYNVHSCLLFHA